MGGREDGREEGWEGGWEGGREGGREGERERGREGERDTIEVGSRGLPNMSGFESLRKELKLTKTQTHDLMVQAARRAMLGSFSIWCSRNQAH